MDFANIQDTVVQVGTALGVAWAGWQAFKSKKQATEAKTAAEPTGNGFAARVLSDLGEIKADGKRTAEKLDRHIEAHANGSIRPAA